MFGIDVEDQHRCSASEGGSKKLTLDREVFVKFREVFANFSSFSNVFERVWVRSDAFGRVRMRSDAFRCD